MPRFRASCAPTLRPPSPALRESGADLVVDFGDANAPFAAFADLLQRETGIPVAAIDGRLARSGEALALLGRLTASRPAPKPSPPNGSEPAAPSPPSARTPTAPASTTR